MNDQENKPLGELLMIHYYFPPVKVVGAIRIFHFHTEAKKYFADIQVITSNNRRFMRQDPDLETNNSKIHPISTWDLRRLQLMRKKRASPHLSTTFKSSKVIQFLQKLADSFPFSLLLADGGLWYIGRSYRKGKQLVREGQITHLFSSYRPTADHWVAFLLKWKYPHLFWVADFRDPPIDACRKNVIWPNLQRSFYRFILRKADLSTTVSLGQIEKIQELHTNVHLLPNGIGKISSNFGQLQPYKEFTITYTGSIYPSLHPLDYFFEVIQQMKTEGVFSEENIKLVYAGKDGAYWDRMVEQFGLKPLNRNLGLRTYREAKQLQSASHVNLLLTWSHPDNQGVLTAKLFDYLEAGRPIIAIINGQRDLELEGILRESDLGEVLYPSSKEIGKEIRRILIKLYEDFRKGEEGGISDFDKLKPYLWKENMRGLLMELQFLSKNKEE